VGRGEKGGEDSRNDRERELLRNVKGLAREHGIHLSIHMTKRRGGNKKKPRNPSSRRKRDKQPLEGLEKNEKIEPL